jgi:ipoprotein LpqH
MCGPRGLSMMSATSPLTEPSMTSTAVSLLAFRTRPTVVRFAPAHCRHGARFHRMPCRIHFLPMVVLAVTALAGCSSGPSGEPSEPGTLGAGTAQITVNDNDLGQFHAVRCVQSGDLLTITTGDDESGSITVISNADGLTAKSVVIRNLGGFSGSFQAGLDGTAEVAVTDGVYKITGQAEGFRTDKPSFRAPGTFDLQVAC